MEAAVTTALCNICGQSASFSCVCETPAVFTCANHISQHVESESGAVHRIQPLPSQSTPLPASLPGFAKSLKLPFASTRGNDVIRINSQTVTTLILTNEANDSLAFNMKTNKPEVFIVNPSRGLIRSQETKVISITCRREVQGGTQGHKFLVQTAEMTVSGEENQALEEVWRDASVVKSLLTLEVVFES